MASNELSDGRDDFLMGLHDPTPAGLWFLNPVERQATHSPQKRFQWKS